MVRAEIIIVDFEDKRSKDKKTEYCRFKCEYANDGGTRWISAFKKYPAEKQMIEDLKANEGNLVAVEIEETGGEDSGGNPNLKIAKFLGKVAPGMEQKTEQVASAARAVAENIIKNSEAQVIKPEKFGNEPRMKPYEKDPVGLAVEIFVALDCEATDKSAVALMETSINLVKQAREAFS